MIPKVIHFCWFGHGEKNQIIKKCMKSWKKKCPDFEIIEWNEDNFNVNINQFCKEAYREKKWAFVSDYARIWILYNYGGVYLDTDIELLKNIEPLLINKAFTGFEGQDFLQTGIMGCEKNDPIMGLLLEKYETKSFYTEEGKINMTPNVVEFTDIFRQRGLILNDQFQMIDGWAIYPRTYFTPIDPHGNRNKTKNSYTDHHFTSTWEIKEKQNLVAMRRSMMFRIKKQIYLFYKKIQNICKR